MLAFGTSDPPHLLASLGAPFRKVDFSDLPQPEKLQASHGTPIAFRVWPANPASEAGLVVIMIHGSSAQSASIHPLGKALSAAGIPVYAPDIRGHGDTGTRGDIDYAGQLDDDMADFVAAVRAKQPNAKLVLMGFSSGGGYALHVAATSARKNVRAHGDVVADAGAICADLQPGPEIRPAPFIPRILALLLLDRVGIHAFDHLTTLLLAIDPARSDILVGHYSWLLMRAFGTRDYAADVHNAQTPLSVVVGEKDELFYADKFAPTLHAIKPEIPVTVVPGLSHTQLTTDPSAVPAILAAVRGGSGTP